MESNSLGPREILLMDRPSLLISTPKDRLLGKGLSRVSLCMSSTTVAWGGIEAMEQKEFTTSVMFGLNISKAIQGLLLLRTLSSSVLLLWRDRGVNVRLCPLLK